MNFQGHELRDLPLQHIFSTALRNNSNQEADKDSRSALAVIPFSLYDNVC